MGLTGQLCSGLAGLIALTAGAEVAADEPFRGKTVTYIVATSPGGGFDGYGRLTARYMEKHLRGSTFVVVNRPGAGHLIGTNLIYNAKPDGLTIGTFNISVMYSQVTGAKAAKFDLGKMSWIGKAAADVTMLMVGAKSPYRTFADLRRAKEPVLFAQGSEGVTTELRLIAAAYGLNVKVLLGYNGNDAELAIMRGEVVGTLGSSNSLSPFVKNGYGRFVLQIGGEPLAGVGQIAQGAAIAKTADEKAVNNWLFAQDATSRVTAGPPEIPADRLEALRTAYHQAFHDPELLADARKRNWSIEPLIGEDVARTVRAALGQSHIIVGMLNKMERTKPADLKVTATILKVLNGGRTIAFRDASGAEVVVKLSGSRSTVVIYGKDSQRSQLKPGLACTVTYAGAGTEASRVSCP